MSSRGSSEKVLKEKLTVPVKIGNDHIRGSINAPITLVEYGDYECPYTGAAYPIVNEILRQFDHDNKKICFVFRNFPLIDIHPHAQHAAEAAEAAAAQDKFWEMHDRLFEHQRELDDSHLKLHASAVGLDIARFENELSDHVHSNRVRQDVMSGINSGVEGTPTFYINGRRYDGSWDKETLLAYIKQDEMMLANRYPNTSDVNQNKMTSKTYKTVSRRKEHPRQ